MASHNQAISIGRVYEQAFCSEIKTDPPHTYENWNPDGAFEEAVERGAEAVLLYALRLMNTSGVSVTEALPHLRDGRSIEEICEAKRRAPICTGMSASWCPRCGDCTCPDPEEAKDDPRCALHAPTSKHGEVESDEVRPTPRHQVGDPAADPCDDGPGSGKSETEGDECPDGFSNPGAGFCAGLGCCGSKGAGT